ncbi:hypothetical protein GX586_16180, partial [bacterium]|nr:hypothetical protein [bacterium]
ARKHFAGWTKQMTRTPAPGFGSSSWCDVGAENHRALPWNIYASFAEFAWSGRRAEPESQAGRFQQSFYGAGLPRLTWVTDVLPQRLAISPRRSWQLFRKNAFAMIRIAAANPGLQIAAARDEKALQRARRFILNSRNAALLNKEQLDLLGSSIERALSVVHRILFSYRYLEGVLPRHRKRAFSDVVKELAACGRNYETLWLRHNKRPNIEVSLAVIDRVLESYRALERTHAAAGRMRRYVPLDLAGHYNTMFAECSGIPLGASTVNGVPFSFADAHHTHSALKPGADELHIAFRRTAVKDIHLLVNGVLPKDRKAKPGLRVEVFDGERRVLDETLEQVAHLVDWWAPLGEHMWAGNGFAYADRKRVRYGFSPDTFFGIMHVSNFKLPAGTHATGVTLTAVAPEEVQLFAVTLER